MQPLDLFDEFLRPLLADGLVWLLLLVLLVQVAEVVDAHLCLFDELAELVSRLVHCLSPITAKPCRCYWVDKR